MDWTHRSLLIKQVKDIRARYWYMVQSITNRIGIHVICKKPSNLMITASTERWQTISQKPSPVPEANDVKSMLKDPYIFDMLTFTDQYNERDVEIGLARSMRKNSL